MSKYVKVILKTKSRMTDQLYTYKLPENQEYYIGQRVMVPFGRGNNKVLGIIVAFTDEVDESINYKEIDMEIESFPLLNKELIDLAFFMSEKYLSDLSSSISTVLPPGDIVNISEIFTSNKTDDELFAFLEEGKSYIEIKDKFPQITRKSLSDLIDKGIIDYKINLTKDVSPKLVRMVELINNDKSLIGKAAIKQLEIINFLERTSTKTMVQKDLLKKTNSSLSSLKSLEKKELIRIYDEKVYREVLPEYIEYYEKHELNQEQENIYNEIIDGVGQTYLLKGVTGSGKTEVYLHLVDKAIEENKQAIILVPEISLTPQTIKRFAGRFGNRVAVLHSKLSISERFDQWRMIKEGLYDIVVGTRSAIFAPLTNIGVIIIDEEHELTYINEKNPKYDAIDIAIERCRFHKANLVLGSATPRVESYYNSLNADYKLLELKNRVEKKPLPLVHKIDMREELKKGNFSMFSEDLMESINEALENKKQSILFLNKRGHTSYIFCRKCGYVHKCQACEASLTYHKNKNICICHLCGRTEYKPLICPKCGSNAIKEFGAGTQKLEEVTKAEFPNARVARMDADTMSKKGNYEKVYSMMENKEIDILIGTQMLSKGFDFKDVDVVGIMSADISLNLPDYRSSEKTFQLITQVAGRAGRGENQGQVFIQTYNPENNAISSSENHDYESFYNFEIENRKMFKYPPFYDLILIRISHKNRNLAIKRAMEIADLIRKDKNNNITFEVIGPNPAVIERINNRYRFNLLIKCKSSLESIKKVIDKKLIKNSKYNESGYRYFIMINPNSL